MFSLVLLLGLCSRSLQQACTARICRYGSAIWYVWALNKGSSYI